MNEHGLRVGTHLDIPGAPGLCWCGPVLVRECERCEGDPHRQRHCQPCGTTGFIAAQPGDDGAFFRHRAVSIEDVANGK